MTRTAGQVHSMTEQRPLGKRGQGRDREEREREREGKRQENKHVYVCNINIIQGKNRVRETEEKQNR